MSITEKFLNFALATGAEWVMYLLLACSVLSITVIIERAVFFIRLRSDFAAFVRELTDRLNSRESMDKTAAWCAGQQSLEAQVAMVGLEKGQHSVEAAENVMIASIIASRIKLDRGLTILGTLGNNAPFIGLFGTIIGIIRAFHQLANSQDMGPNAVMAEISEALVATAVGLLVAIPAVIAFNFFARKIKTRISNSETVSRLILSHISRLPGAE